jgi:hypothetical protein
MAIKTAESDALKRAAINLGTQFGLSLYNNGSPKDVVGTTLDRDLVDNVVIEEPVVEGEPEDNLWITEMTTAVEAKSIPDLLDIKKRMGDNGVNDLVYQGVTLAKWLDKAVISAGKK